MAVSAFALALLAGQSGGQAHPHVWVTGAATLHFTNDKLDRVGMRWQFDAFFSQVLMGDFDTNQDGRFDADETAAMQNQVFTSLKDYDYFTHMRSGDDAIAFDHVENFSPTVDNGELIYDFDIILTTPIDPAVHAVQMAVYDPTVYVDIILGGDTPVTIAGAAKDQCAWTFSDGEEVSNQGGYLTPQVVTLTCKA